MTDTIQSKVESIIKQYITGYTSGDMEVKLLDMEDVDSLTVFNIMVDIEDCFGIAIGDEESLEEILMTTASIIRYVERRVK